MRLTPYWIAAALIALPLTACSHQQADHPVVTPVLHHPEASTARMGQDLPRYVWTLQEARTAAGAPLDALMPAGHPPLQIVFEGTQMHVEHACNAIGGTYRVQDGALKVDGLLHTMMACADPALNRMEKAALHVLQQTPQLSLIRTTAAPRLQMVTRDNETLLFVGKPKPDAASPSSP
ncbi:MULTISPECIES: META domain-containing protein [Oleiagrimonas]|jgi:heat shock protein HslJ|uniref:META domain-containing protein n=1 Tax=Oleiagrimonas citrea TaxID=1665687 RepID=A0A846ZMP9_9GAMM|nr:MULTISPECIES: META domain-containing protein [Oleiagrimonas]NKZ39112.1 META domain-containing protein [Oleiagrimonas citrea]RAP57719.1 hypothetical protein BTJ49_07440 [Oleiagrimonas sp. MCCC 1A03011]